MSEERLMRWSFSPNYGLAMTRLGGSMYQLKAPWCRALPSERFRMDVRVLPIAFGWRVNIRKCATPTASAFNEGAEG